MAAMPRARHFDKAELGHDPYEFLDFRGFTGHFEDKVLGRRVDHLGPENLGNPQRFDALFALAGHLDQRQFALQGHALVGEIAYPVDGHQPLQLMLDLLDYVRGAARDDGDARQMLLMLRLGHRQTVDVVATP